MFKSTLIALLSLGSLSLAAQTDLKIEGQAPFPYYQFPVLQAHNAKLKARVTNLGQPTSADFTVSASEFSPSFYRMKSVSAPFASTDTAIIDFDEFDPELGLHSTVFNIDNPNDLDPSNNSDTVNYMVTKGVYSYSSFDTSDATGILPYPGRYQLRQKFSVVVRDTIQYLEIYLKKPQIGAKIWADVEYIDYKQDTASTLAKLVTVTDTLSKIYKLTWNKVPLIVYPGQLIVGVFFFNADPGIAVTDKYYYPGSTYFQHPDTEIITPLDTSEDRHYTPMYRAVTRSGSVGISKNFKEVSIDVFPNPAKDYVNINAIQKASVNVINQLGQVIDTFTVDHAIQYSLTHLESGSYFLSFTTDNAAPFIQKIIKL